MTAYLTHIFWTGSSVSAANEPAREERPAPWSAPLRFKAPTRVCDQGLKEWRRKLFPSISSILLKQRHRVQFRVFYLKKVHSIGHHDNILSHEKYITNSIKTVNQCSKHQKTFFCLSSGVRKGAVVRLSMNKAGFILSWQSSVHLYACMKVMRLFLFRRLKRRFFPWLVFFHPGTQTQRLVSEIVCVATLFTALQDGNVFF